MKTAFFLLCFLCPFLLKAQQTFPTQVSETFSRLFDQYPQEKVYLHTDKSVYAAGDNIWLKAYLADATYHVPNLLSKYVYVELVDHQDSVCQQIKLRQTDSCFFGNFRLTPDIKPGEYCLRAYTNWMQNQAEAFFFKKNITLVNPTLDVNIHTNSRRQGSDLTTTLTLVNSSGEPYANQRLKIILRKGKNIVKHTSVRTDDKGRYLLIHPAADSVNNLGLSFPYDLPFAFNQTVWLPDISTDFDLQFFPEGGNLLTGLRQKVAFKAICPSGLAAEVSGLIYDSHDKPIARFRTTHRGMGTVAFFIQPGETYYADATASDGTKKRIQLPAPIPAGYALKASRQPDATLLLSVVKASETVSSAPLYLLAHTRGHLVNVIPVDDAFIGTIDPTQFPAGILHFVLADTLGNIYSERLCFIAPQLPSLTPSLTTDKNNYDRRELVKLSLQLPAATNALVPGSFSVAVTDDNMVRNDSLDNNIISYYLLASDLKGYIEAPGSYIHETPEHTDLLMLTHGWTRFNVKNILAKQLPPTPHALELTQQLHGLVTNLGDKPMPNAKVQVFVPSIQTIGQLKTDLQGKFTIRDVDFCDSTLFFIRGYKEKGGKQVNIKMETPVIASPNTFFTTLPTVNDEQPDDFLKRFKGDYYYQDGVKIYVLAEANVVRHRPSRSMQQYTGEYTDMADQIIGQEELSKYSATSIFQLLMRLPGVYVSGETVSIRNQGTPLFMLDGIPTEADFISAITPDDVDNIGVIKDGARLSFFGSRGANGVIIINTKHGVAGIRPTPGLIKYYPKGYFQPDEFYMPAYDRPEEKEKAEIDYRSTIYWQPNVVPDSTGHATISFYTADFPATYTIIVEGMTRDGKVYHARQHIRRN